MVNSNPLRVPGPWDDGYVLERRHTLSSGFLGHDSIGHPQFDTKRSELGELVFRLKNRNNKGVVELIGAAAIEFLPDDPSNSISLLCRQATKVGCVSGDRTTVLSKSFPETRQ
jgi:hypothetical protein